MKLEQIGSWLYFACCITLMPSFPILADFVVQDLLVVLLCCLVITKVEVLSNTAVLGTSSGPIQIFGLARLRGLLMFFGIIFMLFTLPNCISLNTCPVKQHTP